MELPQYCTVPSSLFIQVDIKLLFYLNKQAVAHAPVTQGARVRSPVGTIFLDEVS